MINNARLSWKPAFGGHHDQLIAQTRKKSKRHDNVRVRWANEMNLVVIAHRNKWLIAHRNKCAGVRAWTHFGNVRWLEIFSDLHLIHRISCLLTAQVCDRSFSRLLIHLLSVRVLSIYLAPLFRSPGDRSSFRSAGLVVALGVNLSALGEMNLNLTFIRIGTIQVIVDRLRYSQLSMGVRRGEIILLIRPRLVRQRRLLYQLRLSGVVRKSQIRDLVGFTCMGVISYRC